MHQSPAVPDATPDRSTAAVVLNWRDAEQTLMCIDSLLAEPLVDHIVVVDNEATGELRAALAAVPAERMTLIESAENRGFSAGVNLGLRAALAGRFDSFLMLNNDAVLHEGALARLRDALDADPALALVGPKILNPDGTTQSTGSHVNRMTFATSSLAEPGQLDYLTWACVLLPRSTLECVGLLDERYFMYWEDVDYGFRVTASGARQRCVPEALVTHNVSSSHSSAGTAIREYSALGLSVFARSRGLGIKAGARVRLFLKVAKQLARRNLRLAQALVEMWRLGKRIEAPAYAAIAARRSA